VNEFCHATLNYAIMNVEQTESLEAAQAFLRALEAGASRDELDAFYHPDVEQAEYPNAITRQVTKRSRKWRLVF
jgi:hypothetical protein